MAVSSSGSATYPAILRAIPTDPALNSEFVDLLFLLALAGRVSTAALCFADENIVSIVAAYGVQRRTHRRENSLCDLALTTGKPIVITDVLADPRVTDRQRVALETGIRFYAAIPLMDSVGRPVATLFVADKDPRTPSPVFLDALDRTAARISLRLRQRAEETRSGRLKAERDSAVQKLDLHRAVIANMAEGVVVLRASDGLIQYANPTFEAMFGYPASELIGLPASILNSPRAERSPETVATEIIGRLRSTGWAAGEILNTRKDGTDFWTRFRVASHLHPVLGELWIFVQEDTTERRKAEAALRESEAHYRRIVETALEGIWLIDAENRTTFANPAMAKLLGYTVEEMAGASLFDYMNDQGRRVAQANIERRRQGISEQYDLQFVGQDGREIRAIVNATPIFDETGRYCGSLGMVSDVTERRKSEEALREAESLLAQAKRMQAIGRLAGGISHEFNNVLTTVLGHSELALPELPPGSPVRERLDVIRESALRAAALTQHLLAFSGKQVLTPRTVDLVATLARLEPRIARAAGPGIAIRIVPAGREVWAKADPQQLEMTFLSLVSASRERMPRGGHFVIEVAPDAGGGPVPVGNWACIVIRDSGPVPSPDRIARIFEPYSDPSSLFTSTGLAFAVAYGFLTQSGGHALAGPSAEGGLEIRMVLPASARPDPAGRPTSSLGNLKGSGTVLVVEDEAPLRGLVRQVLTAQGYDVLEAASGEEALQVLAAPGISVALVLSDIQMSGISGRELARRMKKERPGLPVLLMSGFDAHDGAPEPASASDGTVLSKPFRPRDLARAVKDAMKSKLAEGAGSTGD